LPQVEGGPANVVFQDEKNCGSIPTRGEKNPTEKWSKYKQEREKSRGKKGTKCRKAPCVLEGGRRKSGKKGGANWVRDKNKAKYSRATLGALEGKIPLGKKNMENRGGKTQVGNQ